MEKLIDENEQSTVINRKNRDEKDAVQLNKKIPKYSMKQPKANENSNHLSLKRKKDASNEDADDEEDSLEYLEDEDLMLLEEFPKKTGQVYLTDAKNDYFFTKKKQNYLFLAQYKFYNMEYRYEMAREPYKENFLINNWDKLTSIFANSIYKYTKDIKLEDITGVHDIEIQEGQIIIKFKVKNKKYFLTTTVEKLFSDDLFIMYRNFLFINKYVNNRGFSTATFAFECYKWLTLMKPYVGNDYSLETLIVAGARDKKKEQTTYLNLIEEEVSLSDVEKIFFTRDRFHCILVKKNKKHTYMTLSQFQNSASQEDYDALYTSIINKTVKEIQTSAYLDTLLKKNDDNKLNKEQKKKALYQNTKDRYYNEGNCLFFALKSFFPSLDIKNHVNTFKNKSLKLQVAAANDQLKLLKKRLKRINQSDDVLSNYLLKVKNPSILFFYYRTGELHAEAVDNFSFIEILQDHITLLLNKEVHIIHYELIERTEEEDDEVDEELEEESQVVN